MSQEIGKVIESAHSHIGISINDATIFERFKRELQIGKYIKVQDGNHDYILASVQNVKVVNKESDDNDQYVLTAQPIGTLILNESLYDFKQGSVSLPLPTEKAFLMEQDEYDSVFKKNEEFSFELGTLVQNKNINLHIDGNKFFGKHIAIVGSTGSGKSNAVAKIIQEVVGIENSKNKNLNIQKNSHIVIFDIHSEYKSAFTICDEEKFNLNYLDVEKLKLPYWLMNSEELEFLFIESKEQNSHNQVSQFKKAVILNKEKYNQELVGKITYDTPIYFDINEVYNYITNINNEIYARNSSDPHKPKLADGTFVDDKNDYFSEVLNFTEPSAKAADKTNNGPFYGEFNRFLSRLETKINDKRLDFMQLDQAEIGSKYKTSDFSEIIKQFLGYLDQSNITIIDLSGIPFEVLSITTSLISRLIFDFAFHYSKLKHNLEQTNDIPFMIVCEEAHNYIPRTGGSQYSSSKKSLERVAKEGRKYGLSMMVISQRPSEVSETIFAQCSNFVALRLTNVQDQNYIKSLLPENSNSITDVLPTLAAGECLVVGDATPLPSLVQLDKPSPQPKSENVRVHSEWQKSWVSIEFEDVIKKWRNE